MKIRNAASTGRNELHPGQVMEMSDAKVSAERKRSKVIDHWFKCGDLVDVTKELEDAAKAKAEAAAKAEELDPGLVELAGAKAGILDEAGFGTIADLADASIDALTALPGIGEATATDLMERALEAATSGAK